MPVFRLGPVDPISPAAPVMSSAERHLIFDVELLDAKG
jgi:hypothetical protein